MSGADLDKLVRECVLEMVRRGVQTLSRSDVLEQINGMRFGRRVEHPQLRAQIESTAYHEAGHAVVSLALDPEVRVQQVTIVPRGQSAGVTVYDTESWSAPSLNRTQVMHRICTALAGRIAEARYRERSGAAPETDSGASSDLSHASRLAWLAITEWGLDDEFGWVSLAGLGAEVQSSLHARALERVQDWLGRARKQTEEIVEQHWSHIDRVARYLLDHELVEGNKLQAIVRGES
jgi:ATP-dependent Zn protease